MSRWIIKFFFLSARNAKSTALLALIWIVVGAALDPTGEQLRGIPVMVAILSTAAWFSLVNSAVVKHFNMRNDGSCKKGPDPH